MAITITSSYAGEAALPYVAPAILSGNSIANKYITVKTGVKKAIQLRLLDGSNLVQAFACDFDESTSALTLGGSLLDPDEMMTNVQVCKNDFRQDYEAAQTGNGFINDVIPQSFADFMLLFLADKVSEAIEKNIWHGDYNEVTGATTGGNAVTSFAGLLALIVAGTPGAETIRATAGVGFTADGAAVTGITTNLDVLTADCPVNVEGDAKTKVFMSRQSLAFLQTANAAVVTGADITGAGRPTSYMGYDIVVPNGFPNDTLVIGQSENFFFGTDLTSDFNEAKVLDMSMLDGSDNVRVAMRYTGGCAIASILDVGVVRCSS